MSEAIQLLNELDETSSSEEQHIVIDADRFITVPEDLKRLGVQFDHNIETVTFDCPRHWDEHDLSEMNIYVNYLRSDGAYGKFKATDIIVDAENSEIIHFNWTISKNVTLTSGKIVFLVCAKTVDSDGNEQTHWNSERCEDCYISKGLELDENSEEIRSDIIDLWYKQVVDVINSNVGIVSIEQTTTSTIDRGVNVITAKLTNGQIKTFQVRNGSRGSSGTGSTGASSQHPIAYASTDDGILYTAEGDDLPEVHTGRECTHVGKGSQIVFIPYREPNNSEEPRLSLNNGETIPIRLRTKFNQGLDTERPEATSIVPLGMLMVGVPYTMTFCGKYWLIDSYMDSITYSTYSTLSDAIGSINDNIYDNLIAGEIVRDPVVRVFGPMDGRYTVTLVDDIDLSDEITIKKNVDFIMNGHTLNLCTPEACLVFDKGTSCRIDGEVDKSKINKHLETVVTDGETVIVEANGKNLVINGGVYSLSGNFFRTRIVRISNPAGTVEVIGAEMEINNERTDETKTHPNVIVDSKGARTVLKDSIFRGQAITGAVDGFYGQNVNADNEIVNCQFSISCRNNGSIGCMENGNLTMYNCDISSRSVNSSAIALTTTVLGTANVSNTYAWAYSDNGVVYTLYVYGKVNTIDSSVHSEGNYKGEVCCVKVMPGGVYTAEKNDFMANYGTNTVGIVSEGIIKLIDSSVVVYSKTNTSFGVNATGVANFENVTIRANNDEGTSYGVYTSGETDIKNSEIFSGCATENGICSAHGIVNANDGVLKVASTVVTADAPGDNSNEEYSAGISNYGCSTLCDCDIFGTLCGVSNWGDLYVRGGTYTGYSHGGFYLTQAATKTAYVKDATSLCGHYRGSHTNIFDESLPPDQKTTAPYGSMYVGDGSEGFFDSCTFGDEIYNSDPPIVLRGSQDERDQKIRLSNCRLNNNGMIRIDNSSMSVFSGIGNTTRSLVLKEGEYVWEIIEGVVLQQRDNLSFTASDRLFVTDDLYRKSAPDMEQTGKDFEMFKQWFEHKLANN